MRIGVQRSVLAALALLGAGAVAIAQDYGDGTAHGGDLMPTLAGGMIVVLAVLAMFRGEPAAPSDGNRWRPWVAFAGTALFLFLMPFLGFPIVAPLWMGGLMLLLGARHPVPVIGAALLLPLLAHVLLAQLAFAPPPMGLLGD